MSWHRGGPGGRRGYHHGNLREALISAALDLIAVKGPAGFTFAEAARAAGVADVARRGFEHFEQRLAAAWDEGRPSPLAALERMGGAYLGFAREEPAYFSAMFESGLPLADHRELYIEGIAFEQDMQVVNRAVSAKHDISATFGSKSIFFKAPCLNTFAPHCVSYTGRSSTIETAVAKTRPR